ncbi:hypothetical protein WA026_000772 [Henosepilachna vigintioctopunctata]|uniref:Uncharacterized protein n=1 Tax=Henosepilachna vigintioctopunctata TaxID=420089 RepID=A0AAW1UYP1_9CUCU
MPLLVECIQAAIIMLIGDMVMQILIDKKSVKEIDWNRSLQHMGMGLIFGGIVLEFTNSILCSLTDYPRNPCRRTYRRRYSWYSY